MLTIAFGAAAREPPKRVATRRVRRQSARRRGRRGGAARRGSAAGPQRSRCSSRSGRTRPPSQARASRGSHRGDAAARRVRRGHRVNVAGAAPNARVPSPPRRAEVVPVSAATFDSDRAACARRVSSPSKKPHARALDADDRCADRAGFQARARARRRARRGGQRVGDARSAKRGARRRRRRRTGLWGHGSLWRTRGPLADGAEDALPDASPIEGWPRRRAPRAVRGDRVRARSRKPRSPTSTRRALPSSRARDEARPRARSSEPVPGGCARPRRRAVPRVPAWTHPHWPWARAGATTCPRVSNVRRPAGAREGPDMIALGRDERLVGRGRRACSARGDRRLGDRLHRNAWGERLDSCRAMLTQNGVRAVELGHHEPRREVPGRAGTAAARPPRRRGVRGFAKHFLDQIGDDDDDDDATRPLLCRRRAAETVRGQRDDRRRRQRR